MVYPQNMMAMQAHAAQGPGPGPGPGQLPPPNIDDAIIRAIRQHYQQLSDAPVGSWQSQLPPDERVKLALQLYHSPLLPLSANTADTLPSTSLLRVVRAEVPVQDILRMAIQHESETFSRSPSAVSTPPSTVA